ncbi:hypothetical protein [Pedobacter nototheniae]|uniref:hypothetical protein n=1 Tax=Pedobacter nototheniae TaxID=2488994 RepID=UPI001039868C|nr:hypothetical protein [Pedobacter nototheniae]
MALHHATLKAAVALYAILLTQGKNETEIKAEIAKDPKEFSTEEVEEIYHAIVNPKPEKPKVFKHIVTGSFRDIKDFSKEYKAGDDVSDLDPKRLATLVDNGLVEKVEQE